MNENPSTIFGRRMFRAEKKRVLIHGEIKKIMNIVTTLRGQHERTARALLTHTDGAENKRDFALRAASTSRRHRIPVGNFYVFV